MASAFCASLLSVLGASAPASRNLCQKNDAESLQFYARSTSGVNFPSSDVLSPGTGVPDVAAWEPESPPIESSDDAHAESSDATTRNRTTLSAKRFFTRRTYLGRCLMQAAVSD